ncbi:TetR/AcrR family transcriptional regulator [Persicobacter sp. CCB-QB2]|uniref:TetR/AcrR family transcriptional regulator n=1 Tax=Persicobacter sp. CCB-QB2 TaxID=1561025 RepID=UPI0009E27CF1|nr:TetR/AcrR family transcriptional regulator [Persicobacter sp. CCB-QB2]
MLMDKQAANKKKIQDTAKHLFLTQGYTKVTMDDIALNLGMSKKTLYKHFKGKYELLAVIIEDFKSRMGDGVNKILNNADLEYPVKLKQMLKFIAVELSDISPILIEDLQRNVPDLWEEINNYKKEAAFNRFSRLIDEGVKNGHVSPNINQPLVVALYASGISNLINADFYSSMPEEMVQLIPSSPSEIFDHMINIIYEGILTEETKKSFHIV